MHLYKVKSKHSVNDKDFYVKTNNIVSAIDVVLEAGTDFSEIEIMPDVTVPEDKELNIVYESYGKGILFWA